MGRGRYDPCLTGTPAVLVDGGRWMMWYYSGVRWVLDESGNPKHFYHIKFAESSDGVEWRRDGTVCIDFGPGEYAIARPSVLAGSGGYRMWYCYRGPTYRIGYAESPDGRQWQRRDADAGIDVAPDGWDSEMIEYPHVFEHDGQLFMLYNGNGYGKTGVGLAILES
jgi:hypothetical protein